MANNISVKDSGGAAQTVKTTDTAGVHTPHQNIDSLPALAAGTNNIGDVDVLSLPALPAGTNNIGDVDVLTVPAPLSTTGGGTEATALRVTVASDSTGVLSVDDNGGSLTVDGSVSISGAVDTELPAAAALADAAGNPTTPMIGGANLVFNGTTWDRARGDITNGLDVDVTRLPASTNTIEVVGDVAHDAASAGNPLRIGAKAETALSGITLVADGDVSDLFCGVDGVLIVRPHCNLEDVVQERATNTDGASTAFASGLAAPGSGVRLWIKSVTICNSSATFCTVDLRDGAAGSVLWTFPVPATGGVTHVFDPPLKLTANTALAYDASAATTTLTISANGFKSKV